MNEELFGELHEQEEYGLFGKEHERQQCFLHSVSVLVCPECKGHGWLMRPNTCDDSIICPYCDGTGQTER